MQTRASRVWVSAVLGLGLSTVCARGATLTIDHQITGIIHHFNAASGSNAPSSVSDEIEFSQAPLVNVDVSLYTTFEMRVYCASGLQVMANAPTNLQTSMYLYYYSGTAFENSYAPTGTLTFENLTGHYPFNRSYGKFLVNSNGNEIMFEAIEFYTNTDLRFSAWKYSFTPTNVPAGGLKTFTFGGAAPPLSIAYSRNGMTNDPGPFVSLIPKVNVERQGTNMVISWLSLSNFQYQPLWSTNLFLNTTLWSNLGPPVIGNGATNTVIDPAPASGLKYYGLGK